MDLGGQSFDTFDTDWYDGQRAPGKTKSAREHMEWVYDTCVEYAHNFGKRPANLLLFGRPGLGKTHLSAAIAREVSGKGYSVVYDTAGHVFERFEAQKFGRDEADRDVERVLNCDLLIDQHGAVYGIYPVYRAWQAANRARQLSKPRRSASSAQRTSLSLMDTSFSVGK